MIPAFDFGNHPCKTCLSLDFEQQVDGGWIKKEPSATMEKCPLESIPVQLVKGVIEKMNQQSFSRMRRTKKWVANFIEDNRRYLRIALYHNYEIVFNPSLQNGDPEVSFICGNRIIYEKKNIDDDEEYESNFVSHDDFEVEDFGKFTGMVNREFLEHEEDFGKPAITISLTSWRTDPDLQKELTGIYHAGLIRFGSFQTEEHIQLICEFLQFAGLTGRKVEVTQWADQGLRTLCNLVKPIGLCIINSNYQKHIFMHAGFESIKELVLFDCSIVPVTSHMGQLEKLQIVLLPFAPNHHYHDDDNEYTDVHEILQKWEKGESAINELVVFFCRTPITEPGKICVLECATLEKTGFLYYPFSEDIRDTLYFREI